MLEQTTPSSSSSQNESGRDNAQEGIFGLPDKRLEKLLAQHAHEFAPWRMFKIMSEFVQGFEFLSGTGDTITIFGSTRASFDDFVYQEAEQLAALLAKEGFGIITGGGPGVMEAANKGACDVEGGRSYGLNIKLPEGQRANPYVKKSEAFHYFFVRKVMLAFSSKVFIFFPGGFGTLDEFFELITLIQTKKIDPTPVVLINKEYWEPLLSWIRGAVYEKNRGIDEEDMDIYKLVDSAEEALALLREIGIVKRK